MKTRIVTLLLLLATLCSAASLESNFDTCEQQCEQLMCADDDETNQRNDKSILGSNPTMITSVWWLYKADILNVVAGAKANLGEYASAVELCKQANEIYDQLFGKDNPYYVLSLNNLLAYYFLLGEHKKALELAEEVCSIVRENLGEEHGMYAESVQNLAELYYKEGDYQKAVELATKAVDIFKLHPDMQANYAGSIAYLANYYFSLGDCEKAMEYGELALNIRKRIFGDRHKEYAMSLNNMANYYHILGDFAKAVEYQTSALNICKSFYPENSPIIASLLDNLACFVCADGDYARAIELEMKALNIRKQLFGEQHTMYAMSLANLAEFYSKSGDSARAIRLELQALEIYKQVYGTNHPDVGKLLGNLANYYANVDDYSQALELGIQALEIRSIFLPETHPDIPKSLRNMAQYCIDLGNYEMALKLGTQALEIFEQIFGENHPDYALALDKLAQVYWHLGDYTNAIKIGTQAFEICEATLAEQHPDYINSLGNLAAYDFYAGNFIEATVLQKRCVSLQKEHILSTFQASTYRNRQTYWNKSKYQMSLLSFFCFEAQTDACNGEIYDNSALFAKGLLLNAETSLRDLILESGDTAAVKQFESMQKIRTVLNKQYEKPIAERKLNCDSLENVAEQMERELVQSSKAYGDFTRNLTISWKDVQKGLSDGDMAVEFISFPKFRVDTILEREGVQYVALTLKKGYDKPKMITLFEESGLDAIPENRWYADTALCHLVWGQLGDELRGVKNVYFSPDGALYNIGIEQLPCSATENIGERFNMFRLSSTRELALRYDNPSEKSSALYGGLQYYVPPTELLAYNQKKGYSWRTASRDVFEPLPETKTEVENISALLKGHNYDAPAFYAGDEGTEESFKALSGKRTRIIHLATHGCYITPDEADRQRKSDMQQRLAILRVGNDNALGTEEDEALARSYLAMSGGKMCWTSDTIPEGLDDGLLTAQEISRLDLRGCDLVVLSACETGLGDITSEGVMGLQRGFKKAGVQSIVMSLWKVADRPTQEFMTEFYRHLTAGEGKRASFLAAQRFLKEKYPTNLPNDDGRPPYWASFIILDPEVR